MLVAPPAWAPCQSREGLSALAPGPCCYDAGSPAALMRSVECSLRRRSSHQGGAAPEMFTGLCVDGAHFACADIHTPLSGEWASPRVYELLAQHSYNRDAQST
ncbi:hypothetical protein NDU88_009048 [Pleurodeles waltl]|uniref:Uncharacterized protein n=1 Tax=Pleurodeles waltl TaxID=8319 RepID=A0AAV7RVH8_PLEWA|nr:hypothetical protein NDU88_009048 [Pleurodeles waltl]